MKTTACDECGSPRLVEANGFLVCYDCGLVIEQLFDEHIEEVVEWRKKCKKLKYNNHCYRIKNLEFLLETSCLELRINPVETMSWFLALRKLIPYTRYTLHTIAATALALTLITHGYPPRKAAMLALDSLAKKGAKTRFGNVMKTIAFLHSINFLPRLSFTENIDVVYRHLQEAGFEIDIEIKQRVASLLEKLRPRLGGHDPQLLVISAFYVELRGKISFYYLAKLFKRSPSRIRENAVFIHKLLFIDKKSPENLTLCTDAAAGIRTRVLRRGRPAS